MGVGVGQCVWGEQCVILPSCLSISRLPFCLSLMLSRAVTHAPTRTPQRPHALHARRRVDAAAAPRAHAAARAARADLQRRPRHGGAAHRLGGLDARPRPQEALEMGAVGARAPPVPPPSPPPLPLPPRCSPLRSNSAHAALPCTGARAPLPRNPLHAAQTRRPPSPPQQQRSTRSTSGRRARSRATPCTTRASPTRPSRARVRARARALSQRKSCGDRRAGGKGSRL